MLLIKGHALRFRYVLLLRARAAQHAQRLIARDVAA